MYPIITKYVFILYEIFNIFGLTTIGETNQNNIISTNQICIMVDSYQQLPLKWILNKKSEVQLYAKI